MTLRQIYLGYIRSALEYAQPIQTAASKSNLDSVDKLQNQALRLVCGGMRSTPTAALEIDANVEPLKLRRERELPCKVLRDTEDSTKTTQTVYLLTHGLQSTD